MMMRPRHYSVANRCMAKAIGYAINQTYGKKLRQEARKRYSDEMINGKTAQDYIFEAKCWFWFCLTGGILLFVLAGSI